MTTATPAKVKRATIIVYLTVGLAAVQSILNEVGTTDGAHTILSPYFFIEIAILALAVFRGLKNKWTAIIIGSLVLTEAVLFVQDRPISPDELLMIVIFVLRSYVLIRLFK